MKYIVLSALAFGLPFFAFADRSLIGESPVGSGSVKVEVEDIRPLGMPNMDGAGFEGEHGSDEHGPFDGHGHGDEGFVFDNDEATTTILHRHAEFEVETRGMPENMRSATSTDDGLEIEYEAHASVLGLFDIPFTARAEIRDDGTHEVHRPWWTFLFGTTDEAVDTELADLPGAGNEADQNLNIQQVLERRSKAFEVLSNLLQRLASTTESITKNLK